MKIMMLNAYYEPEIAASMYLLTNINEALAERGHQVDVYTPIPTRGVEEAVRREYRKKKKEIRLDGKLVLHRFWLPKERKNTILRALRYVFLNGVLLWHGALKKTDLIFLYSTPPTNGVVAYILRKIRKVPIIYCIQDMFPESLVATGLATRESKVYKIGEKIENITYKGANHFITISEEFKNEMIEKGVAEENISVVRNWVDENAVRKVQREENRIIKKYNLNPDKFYVTYCGNIGFSQNVDLLLEVAKSLSYDEDIFFLLVGEGAYKQIVEKYILENELKNVRLLPFQDYEYISDVFSIGDVGIIASKAGVGGCSVPSKTWSYMSAECAIVASFDSETELVKIVESAECGCACKPDDVEELKQKILLLYGDKELCQKAGQNGRKYILDNLTREVGTGKYVEIVEKVFKTEL